MKYKAIIETDDFEDFEFYEDGNGKYMIVYDSTGVKNSGWIPLYFTECENEPDKDVEYEKDLNKLKEQILKEGDTVLTKRDLLERFCEIDKKYNGSPWNLLQILSNINILIGVEPSAQKWIPITYRKSTQEEKDDYYAQHGEELCYVVENEMPLDGQEVLVSCGGIVSEDVFDEDSYDFESMFIEDVDAWMPKPKSYKK